MVIQYFDALAGSGKTRALCNYAKKLAKGGEWVLFVQPSKKLIDATIRDQFGDGSADRCVRAIHGDTTSAVLDAIYREICSAATGRGCLLFITHEAFLRLGYVERRDQWNLIFDEVPRVDRSESFFIPNTHEVITKALTLEAFDAAYGRISTNPTARPSLQTIVRNAQSDEIWARFGALGNYILSPHWDVFALQSNYHAIISEPPKARQLVTHAVLKPTVFHGFKQVIVASALFQESTLYRLWLAQGEVFQPVSDALAQNLRYHQHGNGGLITIRYLLDLDWSKRLRDKPIGMGADTLPCTIKQQLPGIIKDSLEGKCFAWMANEDFEADAFEDVAAERLPNSPQGLNSYQHLDHVVVLSALNATPAHFSFMATRGVYSEELRTANYRSVVYQSAMRSSIRDPSNTNPKTVTVMDVSTANWLAGLFPGSRVERLSSPIASVGTGKPGRPRRHECDADKMIAYRRRKRTVRMLQQACDTMLGSEASFGTAYGSIHDRDPLMHLTAAGLETFVALLRELHSRTIKSKEDNFLFSPAHFDPGSAGTDTRRGLANIQYLNGVWLDNDGGSLTPELMAEIFPQLRIIAWNTYSSTLQTPRWRCLIPTSGTMTVAEYTRIVDQIITVLIMHGYRTPRLNAESSPSMVKNHGFDIGKFGPASLFYAPCQAKNPADSFFLDYQGGGRQLLDVAQWLENDVSASIEIVQEYSDHKVPELSQPLPYAAVAEVQEIQVAIAIKRWRTSQRGDGHRDFYRLACQFRRSGMPKDRARHYLVAEARQSHSPRDRLADAYRLLGKLWKTG